MKTNSSSQKTYTLFGYEDVDGAIATAICLRHLVEKYAEFYPSLNLEKKSVNPIFKKDDKTVLEFNIESVIRTTKKEFCFSGLLRSQYKKFELSENLVRLYDDYIDVAEIDRSQPYEMNYFFNSPSLITTKLQSLIHTKHPLVNKKSLYKTIVNNIYLNSSIEDFFDSELFFANIIENEKNNSTIK